MQPTVASVSRQLFSVQDTAIHYLFPKHTEMSLNFLSDFLQEACFHQTLCYILSASKNVELGSCFIRCRAMVSQTGHECGGASVDVLWVREH